ncbi:MAG TPA: GNAT family N-acetyltransferase [Cytophagales bacterium]|nr:GNAT family N-acetyltransferase [Cytophagales bacterium]
MNILSVREYPEMVDLAIRYFQQSWPGTWPIIYEDCIRHAVTSRQPLPQWYLLQQDGEIIGGAGLITNDFISRMDLYPWLCALFVDEAHRRNGYANLLMQRVQEDTKAAGFDRLYLSTEHVGYYERYGWEYLGQGYHPWKEESRIYGISLPTTD